MSRKVVRLTADHLATLTTPCGSCLFWELDPVARHRVTDPAVEKRAWVAEVLREWGSCGRVALVDGEPVGYVVYAPPGFVHGAGVFPTAPVSPDAVLMTTVRVHGAHAGGGLGRMLVQGMARDLVERGDIRAVEAFGAAGGPLGRAAGCTVPTEFLSRVGFATQRAHPVTPRMRMELRAAVTWKDEVEAALERLLGAVRPAPRPARPPSASRGRTARAAVET